MDERTKIYNILNTAANRGYVLNGLQFTDLDDLLVSNKYYSIIFDKKFLEVLWGDQWAYQAMKMVRETDKLEYLHTLLHTEYMTRENIKDIFNRVLEEDKRGHFLQSFAESVVLSDSENFEILRPVAFQLINKYNLK